jgi:esterase/lipase superfamily enzyme
MTISEATARPVLQFARRTRMLALALLVSACGSGVYDKIDLMPSPEIYTSGALDPFPDVSAHVLPEQSRLFYVTDRAPAGPGDKQPRYTNERGTVLRAGTARVSITPEVTSWEEIRRITRADIRDADYVLQVADTTEIGPLPVSATALLDNPPDAAETRASGTAFARQINRQLALSGNKDIFIYVHGYNVDFEYPVLVAKELQHFLGYQGAFISYGWAATPNRFAYFKDLETADATRRNLRELLGFLSKNTNVRRINLIGYSAGSRLVFETLYQVALMKKSGARDLPRLGRVVLVGSDLDRQYFAQSLADGLLDAADNLSIYMSGTDSALAMSSLIYGRNRLGQVLQEGEVSAAQQQTLSEFRNLSLIDVTDAEAADAGNGHWYFRSSPWASSDIFVSMLRSTPPETRGLVRRPGAALWKFPPDYPARLARAVSGR